MTGVELNKKISLRERNDESQSHELPLVSVCIITYNHRYFISEAIESVLMQETSFDVEIILHDDCSTDGTTDIVRSYAEKNSRIIRLVLQKKNQFSRGYKPLPIVFNLVRGKYVALLEGDDAWTDSLKLQKQVDFLEANRDCMICYGNARIVDVEGKISKGLKIPTERCHLLSQKELMEFPGIMPTATVMFRNHSILRQLPPEIDKVLNVDSFLFGLLAQYGAAGYLDIEPSMYRQHPNGIYSTLDSKEKIINSLNTFNKLYQCIAPEFRPWVASAIAFRSLRLADRFLQQKCWSDFFFHAASFLSFSLKNRGIRNFFKDTRKMLGLLSRSFFVGA